MSKSKNLTKLGLVENLKARIALRDEIARGIVDDIFDDIETALKEGRTFLIPGVGTLKLVKKKAKVGIGFGHKYSIPERMKLKFTQSTTFQPVKSEKILQSKGDNQGGLSELANSLNSKE